MSRGSNLREYVSHNPPGVTFFLCLLTLAFSFIVLSSYSYSHSLPNPDIEQDWNTLLSSFSKFHLCEKENASSPAHASPIAPLQTMQEKDKKTSINATRSSSVTDLHLHVPLTVTSSSPNVTLKDIVLFTTLTARQLKLGDKELVSLALRILPEDSEHICLTIRAPTHILPMTLRLIPECSASESNISRVPVEVTNHLPASSQTCYSMHFKKDPSFTVMLTLEEKSVVVKHLVEVSVSLLGVCLILCIAASLKTSVPHRDYLAGQNSQSEPLIES
ncbi:insulin-like growth factor-binding protein 3 receptor isoform X1 [Xiphophorus hellerii]|uniref:insulin-like growth factor-binding protein 3 receptor isoform X1 n=1 Tax=Xiphophorus hellerii TaxID=8084 RepID=UPI0013B3A0C4|nr:insulin-like growth factor-binding protein 3 receptor isoform X1 [Xiphophorus hellerii]